jgi:hypothetical protein
MPESRTRLITVALADLSLPSAEAVCATYAESFPEAGALKVDPEHTSADTLALRTPTTSFFVGLLPTPIASAELADATGAAWYWPEAAETLRGHRAQAVVSATSAGGDCIDLMLTLTRVVAAVAATAQALGVYVGGAALVHKVDDFVSEAGPATREQLPLYLWLRFQLSEAEDGSLTLYTFGLSQFELMELEFAPSRLDPQTLMDRAFNISHYLLDHGAVLSDGHTIGTSADERFRVRHAASERAGHPKVYRIEVQTWDHKVPQA